MNTVCALPGCPELVREDQVTSTRGYCVTHLTVGVIEAIDEMRSEASPSADQQGNDLADLLRGTSPSLAST